MSGSIRERWLQLAPRIELACGLVLLALALASRFYRLGSESIWLDEAITYRRSMLALPQLMQDSIARHHTPSYFLLMHFALGLGDDEFMLRLPSAVFGCATLLAALALGRVVGGWRTGFVTAVLCALAPQLLRYSQEARMYAPLVFCTTSALCGLLWLVANPESAASWPLARDGDTAPAHGSTARRDARRAWSIYATSTVAALYMHNTAALFWASAWVVAAIAWLAARGFRTEFARNWALVNLGVLACWAPWLKTLLVQTKEISAAFWAQFPAPREIVRTLDELYLMASAGGLLGTLVALAALLGVWALRKHKPIAAALIAMAVLPPALVLLISLHRPIWLTRLLLWGTPAFFALAAHGIAALRQRALVAIALASVVASGTSALFSGYYGVTRKPRWEAALRDVVTAQAGDATVFMIGDREVKPIGYYTARRVRPIEGLRMEWCYPGVLDGQLQGRQRVFMISANHKNAKPILELMKTRGHLVHRERYGHDLTLYEYRVNKRSR